MNTSQLAMPYNAPVQSENIKLTVVLLSYQQKSFLENALDSVLAQETDFPFEVLVCDDASTDGSAEMISDYASRYPTIVRQVLHKKNLGPYTNYVNAHNRATGEYVAHLDGDDLFLPGKLQRQVDFMDTHPEVAVTWHAMQLIDEDNHNIGLIDMRCELFPQGRIELADALELGSVGVHSATMYRRVARTTISPPVNPIDWFYAVEYLAVGAGYQLDEVLGVYRKLHGSMSSSRGSVKVVRKNYAQMLMYYMDKFPEHRRRLQTHSILFLASDLYSRTASMGFLLRPILHAKVLPHPRELYRALRRFRALSRSFSGNPRCD